MSLQMGLVFLVLLALSSALTCPDGVVCEGTSTCCRGPAGGYTCCPLLHAVKAIVCPDQESECPDDTTCCQLPDGSWGCCPLAKAVCCADKRHCCPEGTQCDLTHSRCLTPTLGFVAMLEKTEAHRTSRKPATVGHSSLPCPGGRGSCPDNTTCCLLTSGDYGCCPYPEAVCCSDQLHCCPGNTTCDLEHETCASGEKAFPLVKKTPALPNDVACPDKLSTCPDQTTCCETVNGSYGCCPMPNAVCCPDRLHCCPEDLTCDLLHSMCVSDPPSTSTTPLTSVAARTPSIVRATATAFSTVHAVPCNDSVVCADGNTCCQTPEGEWACCPMPKAVCCDDHIHCCPHGTTCNLAEATCDAPVKEEMPVISLQSFHIKCDDSTSCPGKTTCCKTSYGTWACCPLAEAVCCQDHVHCCPHGTVCHDTVGTCDDPAGNAPVLPWLEKVAAVTLGGAEKCDRQTLCPAGNTCCKKGFGRWACCPLPQAVCCKDLEHCCPKGFKCNVAQQSCVKPDGVSLPWMRKTPALPWSQAQVQTQVQSQTQVQVQTQVQATVMCDAHTSCPKEATCCFMDKSSKWGCCPVPKGVCCSDGDHCCPNGYTCDKLRPSCTKAHHRIPWFTKQSTTGPPGMLGDVKCDNKSSCAAGTTCCKLETGEWGCCPLVKAVCCEDHEHCCPQGYICNMQSGTCEKRFQPSLSLPQSRVVPLPTCDHAGDVPCDHEGDVPCDHAGEFRCSKQETCCRTSATEWACCPSAQAVCCADTKHCCPAGFSCDQGAGGCTQLAPPTRNAHRWDLLEP